MWGKLTQNLALWGMATMLWTTSVSRCSHRAANTNTAVAPHCPTVYLALGDSTGSGVGANNDGGYVSRIFGQLQRACPATRLVNAAQSGATTNDVLQRQLPTLNETQPTLITLGIGANDLTHGVQPAAFARNYELIVRQLTQDSRATIILMNVPDVSLAPVVPDYLRGFARQQTLTFNQTINELGQRYHLTVIDLFAHSAEFAQRREFFAPDGFHPSAQGYDYWANLLWPQVEKTLNESSTHGD